MATNLVIDADGHCYEPDAGLVKWLPKEFAHLAPNRVTDNSGYSHLMSSSQVCFTCEPEESILPYVLETIGLTQVMYASDYRHWDSEFPESVRKLRNIPGLTEKQKSYVLDHNAIEFFALKREELPERIEN